MSPAVIAAYKEMGLSDEEHLELSKDILFDFMENLSTEAAVDLFERVISSHVEQAADSDVSLAELEADLTGIFEDLRDSVADLDERRRFFMELIGYAGAALYVAASPFMYLFGR